MRKDMVGLKKQVNVIATRSLLNAKESPIHGMTAKHYRQLVASLIAGTHRANDRLKAAGLCGSDMCDIDGARRTSEHVVWECGRWAALRAPYLTKINDILWVAEAKVGKDTAKYLKELLQTPSFRHTGIVNADYETVQWASKQNTRSTCPLDICQECLRWDDQAQTIRVNNVLMMLVFTDGSANAINTDMLAYAGWGFYIHEGSTQNTGGALDGKPTTSYRAEVRAVLEVIWRVRHPTCIITDCKTVCQILNGILNSNANNERAWWPEDDGCNDYWKPYKTSYSKTTPPSRSSGCPATLTRIKRGRTVKNTLLMGAPKNGSRAIAGRTTWQSEVRRPGRRLSTFLRGKKSRGHLHAQFKGWQCIFGLPRKDLSWKKMQIGTRPIWQMKCSERA